MVANKGTTGVLSAPPRELNVWKFAEARASELESLHSVVADRLNHDFRSQRSKRRRTTGHDDRVAKRKFRKRSAAGGNVSKGESVEKDEKKISRRVRRKIELKKNTPGEFVTSGDGTKRLRTHLWHAKRFTMTKLWGFYVPLGLHGSGRGSRAILKKLKNDVLINDDSYCGCVQLEGPQDMLISLLSTVLVPPPSKCCEGTSLDVLSGAILGTAMLHDTRKSRQAPIAPVSFMWRPLQQVTTSAEWQRESIPDEEQSADDGVVRQLWLWIHAAAFEEAYDALRFACGGLTDTARSVSCVSLEGRLGKLDLIGSSVFQLLQKTLVPATSSVDSWHLKKHSAGEIHAHEVSASTSILEKGSLIFSSGIVPFVVIDPRSLYMTNDAIVPGGKPFIALRPECQIKEDTISPRLEHKYVGSFNGIDLWDSEGSCPPVEESVLCMEKHCQRKEFIRLAKKSSAPKPASGDGKYSSVCPVLLLKNEHHQDSSVSRCSVILPLSWVKAFWNSFISNGAHAIGLREKHWVASEVTRELPIFSTVRIKRLSRCLPTELHLFQLGLAYFPWDFPDCNAYSHFMAMEATALNRKTSLLPPSKRLPEVPIPPPWNCVHHNFGTPSRMMRNSLNLGELCAHYDKFEEGTAESSGISESQGAPFEGIVARTSSMLTDYLNTVTGDSLLLFPKPQNQKSCLYKFMKAKDFATRETVVLEPQCGEARCYLRVLLHAYREGVFEQGGVVCAPHVSDIVSWTTRSETENKTLQLPQSSLPSYFVKLQSGEWIVEVPDDPASLDSQRWPIGFITSGFVRGSKKPTASALCEAHLLSKLRVDQWRSTPVKRRRKEIYVLVRNLRSTAYRLALATILLENKDQDLEVV